MISNTNFEKNFGGRQKFEGTEKLLEAAFESIGHIGMLSRSPCWPAYSRIIQSRLFNH
jgi:hypothetical protein